MQFLVGANLSPHGDEAPAEEVVRQVFHEGNRSDNGPCSVLLSGGLLDVVFDVFLRPEVWDHHLGIVAISSAVYRSLNDVLNSSVECSLAGRFALLLLDDGSVLLARRCRCYREYCPRLGDFKDRRGIIKISFDDVNVGLLSKCFGCCRLGMSRECVNLERLRGLLKKSTNQSVTLLPGGASDYEIPAFVDHVEFHGLFGYELLEQLRGYETRGEFKRGVVRWGLDARDKILMRGNRGGRSP